MKKYAKLLFTPVFWCSINIGFLRHNNEDKQVFCSKLLENRGGEKGNFMKKLKILNLDK